MKNFLAILFYCLHRDEGVNLQMGGQDQWGNPADRQAGHVRVHRSGTAGRGRRCDPVELANVPQRCQDRPRFGRW